MNTVLEERIKSLIRTKRGERSFCRKLKGKKAKILDVGCGNGSPRRVKMVAPDCYYVGVDVSDYNNTNATLALADKYMLFEPEHFADGIAGLDDKFDAVLSSHNIEHCNHPNDTLNAMCGRLKKGGRLYLAFPSEASADFPSRKGTLNFYDDSTHRWLPKYDNVIQQLKANGMEVVFASKQYKPHVFHVLGGILEPLSKKKGKVLPGITWAYWGFETIIWAEKREDNENESSS